MPKRNSLPPVLAGRHPKLIAHFWRDYERASEQEKALPVAQRFVTKIGPTYAAIGWLMRRDFKYTPPASTHEYKETETE